MKASTIRKPGGAIILAGIMLAAGPAVQAGDKAGAFIGGMLASKVLTNMSERTEAEKAQAYYAQQQAQASRQQAQPVPQASAQQSPQQKLDQLDKLAAGGYITPDEYKAKRQQILDSM